MAERYGTDLTGLGGYEGGVTSENGAALVSTSSDGETALLFGPAALREIQTGIANGDWAISPDDSTGTITNENPLPYWTVTTVGSTCSAAIVADASQASGKALQVTVAAGTGGSITLTRYVALPGTRAQTFSAQPVITLGSASNNIDAEFFASGQQFNAALTSIALTTVTLNTLQFNSFTGTKKKLLPDADQLTTWKNTAVASDAAFYKISLTFQNAGTTLGSRTIKVFDVRLITGSTDTMVAESVTPATYGPAWIRQESGVLKIQSDVADGSTKTISLSSSGASFNGAITAEQFNSTRTLADNDVFICGVSGDSVNRFLIEADGGMFWGSGSSARDVNLYRSAANVLRTDDGLEIGAGSIGSNGTFTGLNANLTGTQGLRHDTPATTTQTSSAGIWVVVSGTQYQLRRNSSSARYKTNIVDADEVVLEAARKVKPRHYESTIEDENGATRLGFIAEEIHDAGLTHAVGYDAEGKPETIDPTALIAALWHRVSDLEARLAALEAK